LPGAWARRRRRASSLWPNDPAERLHNPVQEQRARALFRDIRCLQCQNQSIDESDADLAEDLRKIIRAQVAEGRSDAEIKRYIVDRYGEFALERPTFSPANAILWGAPFAVVILGGAALWLRPRRILSGVPPLTPEEEAEVNEISSHLT
jgi:cytochrome c-type biogenesis protein CcmH